jgi:hypothetical protein
MGSVFYNVKKIKQTQNPTLVRTIPSSLNEIENNENPLYRNQGRKTGTNMPIETMKLPPLPKKKRKRKRKRKRKKRWYASNPHENNFKTTKHNQGHIKRTLCESTMNSLCMNNELSLYEQ